MEANRKLSLWARPIEKYYSWKDAHTKEKAVDRKTYLRLCFLAIVGANQFYAGHHFKGLVYLLFSWTGIPIALGVIDWMAAVPKQADENGKIMI